MATGEYSLLNQLQGDSRAPLMSSGNINNFVGVDPLEMNMNFNQTQKDTLAQYFEKERNQSQTRSRNDKEQSQGSTRQFGQTRPPKHDKSNLSMLTGDLSPQQTVKLMRVEGNHAQSFADDKKHLMPSKQQTYFQSKYAQPLPETTKMSVKLGFMKLSLLNKPLVEKREAMNNLIQNSFHQNKIQETANH